KRSFSGILEFRAFILAFDLSTTLLKALYMSFSEGSELQAVNRKVERITARIEYVFIFLSRKRLIKNARFCIVIISRECPLAYGFSIEVDFESFRLSLGAAS